MMNKLVDVSRCVCNYLDNRRKFSVILEAKMTDSIFPATFYIIVS